MFLPSHPLDTFFVFDLSFWGTFTSSASSSFTVFTVITLSFFLWSLLVTLVDAASPCTVAFSRMTQKKQGGKPQQLLLTHIVIQNRPCLVWNCSVSFGQTCLWLQKEKPVFLQVFCLKAKRSVYSCLRWLAGKRSKSSPLLAASHRHPLLELGPGALCL